LGGWFGPANEMNAVSVIAVLAIWQLLIVANQLPLPWLHRNLKRCRLRIFPRWDMFVGPQTHLSLYYRDRNSQGEVWEWIEVPTALPPCWHVLFWFPDWDHYWCLRHTMILLLRYHEGFKQCEGGVEASNHYRSLKYFVERRPLAMETVARQFKIERSFGWLGAESVRRVYRSGFFEV
jgi:hypothetical protein